MTTPDTPKFRRIAKPEGLAKPSPAKTSTDGSITTRLNKRMAELQMASRREADDWIGRGWVKVNGEVALMGMQVTADARIEVNKTPARDLALGMSAPAAIFIRLNGNFAFAEGANISVSSEDARVDVATSLGAANRDHMYLSCNEGDLAFSLDQFRGSGMGCVYNNQNGNAGSAIPGKGGGARTSVASATSRQAGSPRNDGTGRVVIDGIGISGQDATVSGTVVKSGDTFIGAASDSIAMRRSTWTGGGLRLGASGTSIGVTGSMTAGSAVIALDAGTLHQSVQIGSAISIAGAGVAASALSGIIGDIMA